MNIFDCFMYFDEDMLLDLRLHMLNKYIKKFIIVESTFLHNGKPKKLNFDLNKFDKFKDKIEYIIVDSLPSDIENINLKDSKNIRNSKILINALKRENYQRNMISKGFKEVNDNDLIIISDVDEIPNLKDFRYKKKISFFKQRMFYYKFNLVHPNMTWMGSRACKKKFLISPQWLRNIKEKSYPLWRIDAFFSNKKYGNIDFVNNGGWHFTNIKTPQNIHFKLSSFLHHLEYEESNLDIKDMEKMIKEKRISYDHTLDKKDNKWNASISLKKVVDRHLPEYLVKNKHKYKIWFENE